MDIFGQNATIFWKSFWRPAAHGFAANRVARLKVWFPPVILFLMFAV